MVKTILLIEDFDDIDEIKKLILQYDVTAIYTLNYLTHITLIKNNIEHKIGEEYLTDNDYKKIDELAIHTTTSWHKNESIGDAFIYDGINLATSLELEFIQYFSKLFLSIVTIMKVIEVEKPKQIIAITHVNDFIKKFCESRQIHVTSKTQTQNQYLILDKFNIKFNLISIPITFHISRKTFLRIKNSFESIINRVFSLRPDFNSNKKCILLLDFNTLQYEELLNKLSTLDKNILLLNQRRPAIWNFKSLQIVKKSKCKVINLNFFEKKLTYKINTELNQFGKKLDDLWNNESNFENIFSINSFTYWHAIKNSFISICNTRFRESIRRILLTHELFKHLKISVILEWAETAQEEKEVILIAKRYGIKSVLLQHAMYPTPPFLEPFGRFLSYFNYPLISDKQAIWGDAMKNYAISHGFAADNILVTGSPRHDQFFNHKQKISKKGIIVIATTGSTAIAAKYSTTLTRIDYDKFTRETIRVAKLFSDKKIIVKLAPHQEHVGIANVAQLIREIDPNIPLIINANLPDLLSTSDLLITFNNSTIALESIIMNKPTVSIQTEDWLKDEEIVKSGALLSIDKLDEIENKIKKLVYDEEFKNQILENAKAFLKKYMAHQGHASTVLAKELDKF
ncbi:MAG: hypothetical protein QXY15_08705 [Candidatus Nitrosotenuis sp.]